MVELIEMGVATLQLCSTKPPEHESACSSAMATCDVPPSKGGILWSFCTVQTGNHLCHW